MEQLATPSTAILDGRVRQSTPERGHRAGYGGKRRKGSKAHVTVHTPGQLLRVVVTPANAQERDRVGGLCERALAVTGQTVQVGCIRQGCCRVAGSLNEALPS